MTETTTEAAQTQPDQSSNSTAESKPDKTFTQAEVDELINRRFAKERSKYADYDELKQKAVEFDKAAEATKSELDRAVDSARKEGAKSAMQAANLRLVRSEARALAAASKFRDPSDAVAFLGDLSSVKVSAEGDVDVDSLKSALADLAKNKPYLLAEEKSTRPTGDVGQGPRNNGSSVPDMNQIIRSASGRA